ncbi:AAA family ATPase [Paucilactobacillus nenjiangensis]|uniref:ATP-binding protein n=1 Tax=Paucilactobacillus nenjiangensis TaxID=1296540 RepID=A0A5P1X2Z1_9LACO|nr:ATP-binding protein [Paucilactobacillus nenjiangensis]QER68156.1 ATP-binding protein [Paucilactobacillus nenjiangensis]
MTKLSRIIIDNLKNVVHGEMNFKSKDKYLNVVGIYGQNGSGKTTLIDAVGIYHDLVTGRMMKEDVIDYLNADPSVISILFENDGKAFEYVVRLELVDGQALVTGEKLRTSKLPNHTYKKDVFSFEYDVANNETKIEPEKGNFSTLEIPIIATAKDRKSFVFGNVFHEWLKRNEGVKKYSDLRQAVTLIQRVALQLNIHTEVMNGYLATGNFLPLSFVMNDKHAKSTGTLPVSLQKYEGSEKGGLHYKEPEAMLIKNVFAKISNVIEQIVPGMTLLTKLYEQTTADGEGKEFRVEILTNRQGKIIPLRAESLGVQKLISILALLMEVYNNPNQIVFIDELDSGIFEYLLGELVQVMSDGARGQLIFTSHNLRVLETLPESKIYFSTNDENNRYVQIKGTRDSNNLRNLYLREILLNESERSLYENTDTSSIKFAFEDADLDDEEQAAINPYHDYSFGL